MYQQRLQQLFRSASFPVQKYGPSHFVLTKQVIGELRERNYIQQWQRAIQREWFHVQLEDHSLFLFSDDAVSPSFNFLHSPIETLTMREYLASQDLDYNSANIREHSHEYEMLLETASLRERVLPIRFDYHPKGYKPGEHPAAHIHIGLENNVRIAVSRCMSAESFVLFVMRQMYPDCWRRLISKNHPDHLRRLIRTSLPPVPADKWTDTDQIELHFA